MRTSTFVIATLLLPISVYMTGENYASGQGGITPGDGGNYTLENLSSLLPDTVEKRDGYYLIKENLTVSFPDTLTILSGDVVKFAGGAYLNVRGRLLCLGASGDDVKLLPYSPIQSWGGIYIYNPNPSFTTIIRHSVIVGGMRSVFAESSSVDIEGSTISGYSRSGVEGVGGGRIKVRDTTIRDGGYYGIYLEDSHGEVFSTTITNSSTGIKTARSTLIVGNSHVTSNRNTGIYVFETVATVEDSTVGMNPSYNFIISRSSANLTRLRMNSSVYNVYALYSSVNITSTIMSDTLKDSVHSISGCLNAEDVSVERAEQSAFDLNSTHFSISFTTIRDVGHPEEGYPFSAFYMTVSDGVIRNTRIENVGFSYLEMVRSEVEVVASQFEGAGRFSTSLDLGSQVRYVECTVEGEVLFRDPKSFVVYAGLFNIKVVDIKNGSPLPNATADLFVPGEGVRTIRSREDGRIAGLVVNFTVVRINGTFPVGVVRALISSPGYISTYVDLREAAERNITLALYPEHPPPTIMLWTPEDGSVLTGEMTLNGNYQGDFPAVRLEIRFDDGAWESVPWNGSGVFNITYNLSGVSPGLHRMGVRTYDGSLYSNIVILNLTVQAEPIDSDGDGLLDYIEKEMGTSPYNPDTDYDGLPDGVEVDDSDGNTTDPLNPDTDGDYLPDGVEDSNHNGRVDVGETDPLNPDTDGDGIPDGKDDDPLKAERKVSHVDYVLWLEVVVLVVMAIILVWMVMKRWGRKV